MQDDKRFINWKNSEKHSGRIVPYFPEDNKFENNEEIVLNKEDEHTVENLLEKEKQLAEAIDIIQKRIKELEYEERYGKSKPSDEINEKENEDNVEDENKENEEENENEEEKEEKKIENNNLKDIDKPKHVKLIPIEKPPRAPRYDLIDIRLNKGSSSIKNSIAQVLLFLNIEWF